MMEMAHGWRHWSVKLHLALQVLLLASCASADDDHGVTFLYPNATTHPELMTMYYLDTANVTYISPFKTPLLYTFCNDGKSFSKFRPNFWIVLLVQEDNQLTGMTSL